MAVQSISQQTLLRLPLYLNYLKSLPKSCKKTISATNIANNLGLNQVQVRKDLAAVSSGGRPKVGYIIEALAYDIENFLCRGDVNKAVIVGAGKLGMALLNYEGFRQYGLNIVAAFDISDVLVDTACGGKSILPLDKLKEICSCQDVDIGIITVPPDAAQRVCDMLVGSGVLAIWNFATVHLNVPCNVYVQDQNMASSLAMLSKHLIEKLSC